MLKQNGRVVVLILVVVGLMATIAAPTVGKDSTQKTKKPVRKTYDVRQLVRNNAEMMALEDLIMEMIEPHTWESFGGIGQMRARGKGKLVITQTPQTQDEVDRFLTTLGKLPPLQKKKSKKTLKKTTTKKTPQKKINPTLSNQASKPAKSDAKTKDKAKAKKKPEASKKKASKEPTVEVYYVSNWARQRRMNADVLIENIITKVAPDSWEKVGGQGAIRIFHRGGALVVRQTEAVHKKIATLLKKMKGR